jgi:TetR/AcrR family transcriptional regulator, regulator of cefoperazone and chloramphenicol sensitivity
MLPASVSDEERWLMGASIIGQCVFYKVNAPVVRLLMGEEMYSQLDVQKVADHISRFSLAAIAERRVPAARGRHTETHR